METFTISLSSGTTNHMETTAVVELYPNMTLLLDTIDIYNDVYITRVRVDWGDGSDIYENDGSHRMIYREDSIIDEVLYGVDNIQAINHHTYKPATDTLYKLLTAQAAVEYSNGDMSIFNIPISVKAEGFYDVIDDLNIVDTNIIDVESNNINYILSTLGDGYIIETSN